MLLTAVILIALQAIASLYLPDLNADIINNGVQKGDNDYILQTGLLMMAVSVGSILCAIFSTYFAAKSAMSFGRDVRLHLFKKVQSFSKSDVDKFTPASLITRNTNDVQQTQMFTFMMLTMMVSAPITCIGGAIMAIRQDSKLAWVIAVLIPIMLIIVWLFASKALPLFKSMQSKIDGLNRLVREKLSGIRVIRAFVKERTESARFDAANKDLTNNNLKVARLMAIMMPMMTILININCVAIVWFSGYRIDSGDMPVGNMTAFLSYSMQIMFSVIMAVMMFIMLPRASVSAGRINEVLEAVPDIPDNAQGSRGFNRSEAKGLVEFKNVSFSYAGAEAPVLRNLSFAAKPGQTTAIIGSTGSGKSTLVNLIPRLYDVSTGELLIDGINIKELNQADLHSLIGFVPQKAFLFKGTVASNLRYGKEDATEAEMWEAIETSQSRDFIDDMPEGLNADIEQGGSNVSGGQRQRLSIARALIKKPPIYIFDDSFSALDFKTDAKLRAALAKNLSDVTIIIVAQRVSTVMNADNIVVLEDGVIADMGTHEYLINNCSIYKEIVNSQQREEDLA
jgi:ATP-binding cassette subfamily B protein